MDYRPFTKEERQEILNKLDELYTQSGKTTSDKKYHEFHLLINELKEKYFNGLPVIPISCCPICKTVIYTTFDPYGLDGDWWENTDRTGYKTQACEHFYLFSGAFNSNNIKIKEKNRARILRPFAPYVTWEEIKDTPSIAVISSLKMEPGYTVYVIAYFSNPPKKLGRFYQKWKSESDDVIYANGTINWIERGGTRDFNLLPWIKKGKVFWCDPESGNTALSTKPAEECPFLNLPQD